VAQAPNFATRNAIANFLQVSMPSATHAGVTPRSHRYLAKLSVLTLGAVCALSFCRHSVYGIKKHEPLQLSAAGAPRFVAFASALNDALEQIEPLSIEVESGEVILNYGEKAQEILNTALSQCPSAEEELAFAVDGALESLFMRQVSNLRSKVAQSFMDSSQSIDILEEADRFFVDQVKGLVRPGSSWSYAQEREALRSWLEDGLRNSAALAEERARAATAQQLTLNVITKLQDKLENLQKKAQSMQGGGSPWILSTSYRIPNTPLQVVGKYEQGRANIELNLTPDKDPAQSDASFVDGLGPANLGVSFNLGI